MASFGKLPVQQSPSPVETDPHSAGPFPTPVATPTPARPPVEPSPAPNPADQDAYYQTKRSIKDRLIEEIDPTRITEATPSDALREISDAVREIISRTRMAINGPEQQRLVTDIYNDMRGYGPLQELIERDDISDILVNGPSQVMIEVGGRIVPTNVRFRDDDELKHLCSRIVSASGRSVNDKNPIAESRLPDGSRVSVILPPCSLDGTTLTIRKFRRDKLTLDQLVAFGAISQDGAELLQIISRIGLNIIVSGGTGSGKTTLLNCLTQYISPSERIITCEDTAELQLQQPHVRRLETREHNTEGQGEITMERLVKACLRQRPDRIIIGEVRGPEIFDLLQAMNTGHEGSMGTLHANNPRLALSRMESMMLMSGHQLTTKAIREYISSAIDVIIQTQRLRDGSRRITHIVEVTDMEETTITTQELMSFQILGEDRHGKLVGRHNLHGIASKRLREKTEYHGLTQDLTRLLHIQDSDTLRTRDRAVGLP